ncbi:hypothetical protein [Halospeciosus flavus]|uniref:Uncharacterized protein n=1 Tax=Halospeciosus flavus TaxID=3032283 RepID=A0ABD5Z8W5_9EURY|nr:hypothetical protein [Halospeciosus flavus]
MVEKFHNTHPDDFCERNLVSCNYPLTRWELPTVRVPDAPTAESVDWTALGFERQRALARMVRPPRGPPLAGGAVRAILAYAFG